MRWRRSGWVFWLIAITAVIGCVGVALFYRWSPAPPVLVDGIIRIDGDAVRPPFSWIEGDMYLDGGTEYLRFNDADGRTHEMTFELDGTLRWGSATPRAGFPVADQDALRSLAYAVLTAGIEGGQEPKKRRCFAIREKQYPRLITRIFFAVTR